MLAIIRMICITLYWTVLILFNIRNFRNMPEEASKRNKWIYLLILVNAAVITCTVLEILAIIL